MITVSTRPLTARDRDELSQHIRALRGRGEGLFAATILGTLTGAVLLLLAERVLGRLGNVPQLGAILVGVASGTALYLRIVRKTWRHEFSAKAKEDLAGGVAEVSHYRAKAALRLEELEDEGPAFFVELVDGRVLFVCGQFLYEDDEAGRFPCEEFEASHAPRSRLLLGFDCRGRPFAPLANLPPFDLEEYDGPSIPDEWEIIDRSLQQILAERRARSGERGET